MGFIFSAPRKRLSNQDILAEPNRLRAAWSGIWNAEASRALATLLATADPRSTLVHVHGWTKALSASIFRAIRRMGFRDVVTLHEYFTACPTGGFFDHPAGTICKRKARENQRKNW